MEEELGDSAEASATRVIAMTSMKQLARTPDGGSLRLVAHSIGLAIRDPLLAVIIGRIAIDGMGVIGGVAPQVLG